jgi:spermidine synthase
MARQRSRRRARAEAAPAVRVTTSQGPAELVSDPSDPAVRILVIDGLEASRVDLTDPTRLPLDYLHRLGVALDALVPRGAPCDIVHVGGGAFALPRFVAATRPLARQEVYELEPAVVELARTHLRLRRSPGLRVRVGDAAGLLARRRDATADVVVGDAFLGTEVPAHLAGAAFVRDVHRVLRPGGLHLVNVVDAPPFVASRHLAALLAGAFADVLAFGAREVVQGRRAGNLLLAARDDPLPRTRLAQALAGGPHPGLVVERQALSSPPHVPREH